MNEITINWHIIQRCNYKCTYCFAKYDKYSMKEIHESKKSIEELLYKIYTFFKEEYKGYSLRLNIAGGEPTLSKNLSFIIEKAFNIGFKVSIITNGSKLSNTFIETNAKYISMFAISIDSLNEESNIRIGRTSKKEFLEIHNVIKYIDLLKKLNKSIQIKINTVVNEFNYNDYLGDFIDFVKPDKWKVFQALSLNTTNIYCTNKQFETFLSNHYNISTKINQESNDDMTDSYIMIDPHGRFYQNTDSKYNYSKSILTVDVMAAFKSVSFDIQKFKRRY